MQGETGLDGAAVVAPSVRLSSGSCAVSSHDTPAAQSHCSKFRQLVITTSCSSCRAPAMGKKRAWQGQHSLCPTHWRGLHHSAWATLKEAALHVAALQIVCSQARSHLTAVADHSARLWTDTYHDRVLLFLVVLPHDVRQRFKRPPVLCRCLQQGGAKHIHLRRQPCCGHVFARC